MEERASDVSFAELRPGMRARVCGYSETTDAGCRLQELGFVPGAEFDVVRQAPFNGPVQVCIFGSNFCLRKSEGQCMLCQQVDPENDRSRD